MGHTSCGENPSRSGGRLCHQVHLTEDYTREKRKYGSSKPKTEGQEKRSAGEDNMGGRESLPGEDGNPGKKIGSLKD